MSGASIEATLELRASSRRGVKARIRLLFTQQRVAAHLPAGTAFATRPAMALGMIGRAIGAGCPLVGSQRIASMASAISR